MNLNEDGNVPVDSVTRVEVIGNGREFVRYGCENVRISLQDDQRTLKIFMDPDLTQGNN